MFIIYLKRSNKYNIFILYIIFCFLFFLVGIGIGATGDCEIVQLNRENNMEIKSIFLNNIKVGLSILCIGTVTGGMYGICVLILNGYIVGELIQFLFMIDRSELILRGIIPHIGIEITGLVCFSTIGFVPIVILVNWLKNKSYKYGNIITVLQKVVILLCIATLLILVAAIVECRVSSVI